MPCRRTFAPALQGLHSLDAACAHGSMAPLAGNAGSQGTGNPSLPQRLRNQSDSP